MLTPSRWKRLGGVIEVKALLVGIIGSRKAIWQEKDDGMMAFNLGINDGFDR